MKPICLVLDDDEEVSGPPPLTQLASFAATKATKLDITSAMKAINVLYAGPEKLTLDGVDYCGGMTRRDVITHLGKLHQTVTACISPLSKVGAVLEHGEKYYEDTKRPGKKLWVRGRCPTAKELQKLLDRGREKAALLVPSSPALRSYYTALGKIGYLANGKRVTLSAQRTAFAVLDEYRRNNPLLGAEAPAHSDLVVCAPPIRSVCSMRPQEQWKAVADKWQTRARKAEAEVATLQAEATRSGVILRALLRAVSQAGIHLDPQATVPEMLKAYDRAVFLKAAEARLA
jgi:hypothetical protein